MTLIELYRKELEKIKNDPILSKDQKYFRTICLNKANNEKKLMMIHPNILRYKNDDPEVPYINLEQYYKKQAALNNKNSK